MGFTGVVTVIIFAVLVFALFFIVKENEQKNWRRATIYSLLLVALIVVMHFVLKYFTLLL